MRTMNSEEILFVSGGEQYFVITSEVIFEGIPQGCIASYYQAHTDTIANLLQFGIGTEIAKHCPELGNTFNISTEFSPVSIALVSE